MTSNPLELAVFDPSQASSGTFVNQLAGGKGTLLIYNDSSYTLKFTDGNGVFLKRVLAYTMDKIVLCDAPVYQIAWQRATVAGQPLVLANAAQALMSYCQVDGYQADAVLDVAVPFAMPRLTAQATGVAPPPNGGTIFGPTTGSNYQLFMLDLATVAYVDAFDQITSSTTTLAGVAPAYTNVPNGTYRQNGGSLYDAQAPSAGVRQAFFAESGGLSLYLPNGAFLSNGEVVFSLFANSTTGESYFVLDSGGSYYVHVHTDSTGNTYVSFVTPAGTIGPINSPVTAWQGVLLARAKWLTTGSQMTYSLAAAFATSGSVILPALPAYSLSSLTGTALP